MSERLERVEPLEGCAVCGGRAAAGTTMSRMLMGGRALSLCRAHTSVVVAAMPETFDDLRALFVGVGVEAGPRDEGVPTAERRSPLVRRDPEDRRVFPPRPEGRRASFGRRATDPRD
jgi:hypothetical protein